MKRIHKLYNIPFERKLNIAFGVMAVMSLCLFVLTYFSYTKFETTANWVSQANKVMYFNEQVITEVLNIETTSRGFALTGSEEFLAPFYKAKKELDKHLKYVNRFAAENAKRKNDYAKIEKEIAAKIQLSERIIELRRTNNWTPSLATEIKAANNVMEVIKQSMEKLQKEEMELLANRELSHIQWLRLFNWAMVISLFFMFVILVTSAYNIFNNFRFRKIAERDLAESKQVLQSIIDNTTTVIFTKDENGKFLMVNKQFEKIMGLPASEIVGKKDSDFYPADAIEQYRIADNKVFKNGETVEAVETATMQGKEATYLAIKFPLYDENGKIYALCGMSADITERKKAEEKILELNTTLEANVFRLNNINRELEAFTYSVSHDLRAPLRAINGFAALLGNKTTTKGDEEILRIVNIIKDSSQQMGQLIDDLLAFSRIGRYKPKLEETDMRELADMVLQQLTIDYPLQKISLNIKGVEPITCDPSLIKQVWVNLISNALKYSAQKEVQNIEIGSRKNNNEVVYYIKDNGAGFDMRYYDKLFGIFQRLHSNNDFEGTGVGLAIVHRIVKRHSGRVWAEGEVNNGATFYFSLPKVANVIDI